MNQNKFVYVINSETKAFQFTGYVPEDQLDPKRHITVPMTPPPDVSHGVYDTVWNEKEQKWTHKLTPFGVEVYWAKVKQERNELLAKTDWTQMEDVALTEEKAAAIKKYRQELRDITSTFKSPDEVVWPNSPL